jgi:hypothetical protein
MAIRVCHPSFTDYLACDAPERFRLQPEQQLNTDLALYSLRVMISSLRFNMCDLESSYKMNSEIDNLTAKVANIVGELRYSCRYWIDHLTDGHAFQDVKMELEPLLDDMLFQPRILYWVEVLSLMGEASVAIYGLGALLGYLPVRKEALQPHEPLS